MNDEEAGQVPQVQAQLLFHWEVGPSFIKLTPGGSVWASALALSPGPQLWPTHLLEENHGVLAEAKLLKQLWPVSEAKRHVQGIASQGQEGGHILVLQVLQAQLC